MKCSILTGVLLASAWSLIVAGAPLEVRPGGIVSCEGHTFAVLDLKSSRGWESDLTRREAVFALETLAALNHLAIVKDETGALEIIPAAATGKNDSP